MAWAWHPYNRLSPAQYEFVVFVDNLSKQRFDEILGFLGIPRILAMKYACCAAKAKVMWLTWMLVMLCRLLLLLLLLGLRLSLKKNKQKKLYNKLFTFFYVKIKRNFSIGEALKVA